MHSLRPLNNKKAETIAKELFDIFSLIGAPAVLQSDHGPEYDNKILDHLLKMHNIKRFFTIRAHPQANGQVERAIKTVKGAISKHLNGEFAFWPIALPIIQLQYNDKVLESTGSTPFSLFFNRQPHGYIDNTTHPPTPIDINNYHKYQDTLTTMVFPAIAARVTNIKQSYIDKINSQRKLLYEQPLALGSIVMMKDLKYIDNVRGTGQAPYIGPYTVQKRAPDGGYILIDVNKEVRPHSVSVENLKVLFHKSNLPKRVHTSERSYVIDEIIGCRPSATNTSENEYLVRWKGYEQPTWEPRSNFNDAATIRDYERKLAHQLIDQSEADKRNVHSLQYEPPIYIMHGYSDAHDHGTYVSL